MKRILITTILFFIIGFIIGYLLFGKVGNDYINLKLIFGPSKNSFESFGRNFVGLTKIKNNILISGGIAAVIGFVFSFLRKK